ncbi:HNH endonuclease [Curtobacterium flaccumfaciens]|uniref:HNH endonuclease n=1 Tax=Curtobacterium flaccumfaciens TaxID=2035 RepID=UPI003D9A9070
MTFMNGDDRRPAVPTALKRRLFEEAGYRCAIPTCKGTAALEMAHIEPWSKVRQHDFENMIVLCAVDHTRFDRGEIPVQSIRAFKSNLSLLGRRYNDTEQRILTIFAQQPSEPNTTTGLVIPGASRFLIMFLLKDGIVSIQPGGDFFMNGIPAHEEIRLTEAGVELVRQMVSAQPIA